MNTKAKSYILIKHMGTHMWVYYIQKCVTKMYIYATTQNECLDCRTANTATLNVSQAVLHILSRYIQKWATKMYMQLYFTWNVVLLCTHSSTLSLLHWRRQIFIRERWGRGGGSPLFWPLRRPGMGHSTSTFCLFQLSKWTRNLGPGKRAADNAPT